MNQPENTPRGVGHPFWQAVIVMVVAYLLFQFGIPLLPPLIGIDSAPVPASVVFQFMMTALVGVLLYVSADETRWSQFKQPFNAVAVDADKKVLRLVLLIALPVFIGFMTYRQVSASFQRWQVDL